MPDNKQLIQSIHNYIKNAVYDGERNFDIIFNDAFERYGVERTQFSDEEIIAMMNTANTAEVISELVSSINGDEQ